MSRILIKTAEQINCIKQASQIVKGTLDLIESKLAIGVSTLELNNLAIEYIKAQNARPSFLGYNGYPAAVCISINDEVVHGIPKATRLIKDGDIVSIDVGAHVRGYHSDAARTFIIGKSNEKKQRLVNAASQSFFAGVKNLKAGIKINEVSQAIEKIIRDAGLFPVKELVGHGIGKDLHEEPSIPNFYHPLYSQTLPAGSVICIEPMISESKAPAILALDGFTYRTRDGANASHYENCLVVLSDGVEILTV